MREPALHAALTRLSREFLVDRPAWPSWADPVWRCQRALAVVALRDAICSPPRPKRRQINWTDQMKGELSLLWNRGEPVNGIARDLSGRYGVTVSKGAVVGMAKRMRLVPRASPIVRRQAQEGIPA